MRIRVTWLPDDPASKKMRSTFRAYMLVMSCIGLAFTAGVLALDGLYWMALGQLITLGLLVEYAREARKARS